MHLFAEVLRGGGVGRVVLGGGRRQFRLQAGGGRRHRGTRGAAQLLSHGHRGGSGCTDHTVIEQHSGTRALGRRRGGTDLGGYRGLFGCQLADMCGGDAQFVGHAVVPNFVVSVNVSDNLDVRRLRRMLRIEGHLNRTLHLVAIDVDGEVDRCPFAGTTRRYLLDSSRSGMLTVRGIRLGDSVVAGCVVRGVLIAHRYGLGGVRGRFGCGSGPGTARLGAHLPELLGCLSSHLRELLWHLSRLLSNLAELLAHAAEDASDAAHGIRAAAGAGTRGSGRCCG